MLALARGARRPDAAELGDAGPDPPGGAQLGDGRELVGGDGAAELQRREGVLDGSPASVSARRYATPTAVREAELLGIAEAPASW